METTFQSSFTTTRACIYGKIQQQSKSSADGQLDR